MLGEGGRGVGGGRGAEGVVTSAVLPLHRIPLLSALGEEGPTPERRRRRRSKRLLEKAAVAVVGEGQPRGKREDGVCACALAPQT